MRRDAFFAVALLIGAGCTGFSTTSVDASAPFDSADMQDTAIDAPETDSGYFDAHGQDFIGDSSSFPDIALDGSNDDSDVERDNGFSPDAIDSGGDIATDPGADNDGFLIPDPIEPDDDLPGIDSYTDNTVDHGFDTTGEDSSDDGTSLDTAIDAPYVYDSIMDSLGDPGHDDPGFSDTGVDDFGTDTYQLPSVSGLVGPAGGKLELEGVILSIPAGALDREVAVSISRSAENPPLRYGPMSAMYEFLPTGLTFAIPATVSFTYLGMPDRAAVYWSQDGVSFSPSYKSSTSARVYAQIDHLSFGFAGSAGRWPSASGIPSCDDTDGLISFFAAIVQALYIDIPWSFFIDDSPDPDREWNMMLLARGLCGQSDWLSDSYDVSRCHAIGAVFGDESFTSASRALTLLVDDQYLGSPRMSDSARSAMAAMAVTIDSCRSIISENVNAECPPFGVSNWFPVGLYCSDVIETDCTGENPVIVVQDPATQVEYPVEAINGITDQNDQPLPCQVIPYGARAWIDGRGATEAFTIYGYSVVLDLVPSGKCPSGGRQPFGSTCGTLGTPQCYTVPPRYPISSGGSSTNFTSSLTALGQAGIPAPCSAITAGSTAWARGFSSVTPPSKSAVVLVVGPSQGTFCNPDYPPVYLGCTDVVQTHCDAPTPTIDVRDPDTGLVFRVHGDIVDTDGQSVPCEFLIAGHPVVVSNAGLTWHPRILNADLVLTDRRAITCNPAPIPDHLVTVTATTGGVIVSHPEEFRCIGTCDAEFEEGTDILLMAIPLPGYAFGGWTDCPSAPGVGEPENACRFDLSGPVAITAIFVADPLSVALEPFIGCGHLTDNMGIRWEMNHETLGADDEPDGLVGGDPDESRAFPMSYASLFPQPESEITHICYAPTVTQTGNQVQSYVAQGIDDDGGPSVVSWTGSSVVAPAADEGADFGFQLLRVSPPQSMTGGLNWVAVRFPSTKAKETLIAYHLPTIIGAEFEARLGVNVDPMLVPSGNDSDWYDFENQTLPSGAATISMRPVLRAMSLGTLDELPGVSLSVDSTFGMVTGAPYRISCTGGTSPGRCRAHYDAGSIAYLIATPSPGAVFTGWVGCPMTMENLCILENEAGSFVQVSAGFSQEE